MLKVLAVAVVLGGAWMAMVDEKGTKGEKKDAAAAGSVYDFAVKDINGKDVSLAKYKGDVLMIVNVASL